MVLVLVNNNSVIMIESVISYQYVQIVTSLALRGTRIPVVLESGVVFLVCRVDYEFWRKQELWVISSDYNSLHSCCQLPRQSHGPHISSPDGTEWKLEARWSLKLNILEITL